jgi:hypothetical protein
MTDMIEGNHSPDKEKPPPHRVRLPGFITDEQIGLGDAIKRTTSYFGIKPCRGANNGRLLSIAGWFSPDDSQGEGNT